MYYGNKLDFEDLIQLGFIGLLKGAERFDASLGYQFSTYAIYWIKQTISRGICDVGYTIRIPVHMIERIRKVTNLDNQYGVVGYDYKKRLELISENLHISKDDIEECFLLRKNILNYTSLDIPVGEEEETAMLDVIPFEQERIEDIVARMELKDELNEVLLELTDREEKVLRLRYGLDDGRYRTLEEVGKEFHVTRERIRQIEAKALRKLKHPSRSKKLKDYLGG